jgi:hypothetical protein
MAIILGLQSIVAFLDLNLKFHKSHTSAKALHPHSMQECIPGQVKFVKLLGIISNHGKTVLVFVPSMSRRRTDRENEGFRPYLALSILPYGVLFLSYPS